MTRYRTNGPRFVDESVDGEALIMDMVTGTYFTCLSTSTVAWDALKRGVEPGAVASLIARTYDVALADVERDLDRFVAELIEEEMLVVWDEAPTVPADPPIDGNGSPSGAYEPMAVERYTDLADLIMLDPVQDVAGARWPHV